MNTHPRPTRAGPQEPGCYEIRLEGRLDDRWSAWFDGMTLTTSPGTAGVSVLRGHVVDQAALHGLLARLRDIGLPLISVARVEPATTGPARSPGGPTCMRPRCPSGRSPTRAATSGRGAAGWPVPVALLALSLDPAHGRSAPAAPARRVDRRRSRPTTASRPSRRRSWCTSWAPPSTSSSASLQFVPAFRRHHLTWHRRTGRVLAVAGLLVAGSALWMTLFYAQKPGTGDLLFGLRLVFSTAMAASLVLGVRAARTHDLAAHRAWMIRAYAIGLAAGTQALTEGVGTRVVRRRRGADRPRPGCRPGC